MQCRVQDRNAVTYSADVLGKQNVVIFSWNWCEAAVLNYFVLSHLQYLVQWINSSVSCQTMAKCLIARSSSLISTSSHTKSRTWTPNTFRGRNVFGVCVRVQHISCSLWSRNTIPKHVWLSWSDFIVNTDITRENTQMKAATLHSEKCKSHLKKESWKKGGE